MKRSEAVIAIARALALPTISSAPSGYWMKYAEKALSCIEDLGMLPPEIDKMIEGHQCSVNEWEKE